MSCDVGEVTERLENEQSSREVASLPFIPGGPSMIPDIQSRDFLVLAINAKCV